jgi:hypothetical protein
VFDEVQGIYISRAEHERRARFNSDDYKATPDEITRFPSRPQREQSIADYSFDLKPSIPIDQISKRSSLKLRPPGYRDK